MKPSRFAKRRPSRPPCNVHSSAFSAAAARRIIRSHNLIANLIISLRFLFLFFFWLRALRNDVAGHSLAFGPKRRRASASGLSCVRPFVRRRGQKTCPRRLCRFSSGSSGPTRFALCAVPPAQLRWFAALPAGGGFAACRVLELLSRHFSTDLDTPYTSIPGFAHYFDFELQRNRLPLWHCRLTIFKRLRRRRAAARMESQLFIPCMNWQGHLVRYAHSLVWEVVRVS